MERQPGPVGEFPERTQGFSGDEVLTAPPCRLTTAAVQGPRSHLLLAAEDSEADLLVEAGQAFPHARARPEKGRFVAAQFEVTAGRPLPYLVFARQWLPDFKPVSATSISAWASQLLETIIGVLPDDQPWSLHIEPHYGSRSVHHTGARAWHTARRRGAPAGGFPPPVAEAGAPDPEAGRHRSRLIRKAIDDLLRRKRRHLYRHLRDQSGPFSTGDSLVQLWLTSPDRGYLSLAQAPLPFQQRHLLSCFAKGDIPRMVDPLAPSRAFAKLVEAEQRLGRSIQAGENCVDLGASPGSWTYAALKRGARVVAVDRAPLRQDLMEHSRVAFERGDAFRFEPSHPVDWLLCDVIAPASRNAELLVEWLRRGWCRQFIVTLKLKERADVEVIARLKRDLPALTGELFLLRLCANKREVCAFGVSRGIIPCLERPSLVQSPPE